jgi:hypothetical protein
LKLFLDSFLEFLTDSASQSNSGSGLPVSGKLFNPLKITGQCGTRLLEVLKKNAPAGFPDGRV